MLVGEKGEWSLNVRSTIVEGDGGRQTVDRSVSLKDEDA